MKNNKLLKISGVLLILYVVAFSAYLIVTNNGYSGNAHIPIGNILASSSSNTSCPLNINTVPSKS